MSLLGVIEKCIDLVSIGFGELGVRRWDGCLFLAAVAQYRRAAFSPVIQVLRIAPITHHAAREVIVARRHQQRVTPSPPKPNDAELVGPHAVLAPQIPAGPAQTL